MYYSVITFDTILFPRSSSFVSFTQFVPTCGRMPLPALSLWPGRQPCRPRLVDGRRGGGPSYVAPRIRNPPTERRRDSPISSSLFSHGPPLCAEPVLSRSSRQRLGNLHSHVDGGWASWCLASVDCRVRSMRQATHLLVSGGAIPASRCALSKFVGLRQPEMIPRLFHACRGWG